MRYRAIVMRCRCRRTAGADQQVPAVNTQLVVSDDQLIMAAQVT
ncbi:MAG: hypothetical protein WKF83_09240 [Nocardioidaceae bacterium]